MAFSPHTSTLLDGMGSWSAYHRKIAVLGGLALVVAVAAALPAAASGGPYKVKQLQAISGPSPFAPGCPGTPFDETNITGHELEPAITASPKDPRDIVATWKQDVGPFSTRSDLVASSLDGGKTWTRSTMPGLSSCTGGTAIAGSDPWVSIGGDGTVYFSGVAADDVSTDPATNSVVASHSIDGGRTWPAVATVTPTLQGNDQDSITGSPTIAGHAYAAWANFRFDFLAPSTVRFSRTTDGGASWSDSVIIDAAGPSAVDAVPKILVLPDGTLLAIFIQADLATGIGTILAARSLDEGQTWLPAAVAGSKPVFDFRDPDFGDVLPQPGYESAAVAPDGTVYIAFEDSRTTDTGAIGLLRSEDGGISWSSSKLPGVSAFAFEPAVAVDSHGTVGVIWYDLRNDRLGDAAITADVWFAHSDDRGASWRQSHVAGPTDLRTAPLPHHNYVGEYQGLAALRGRGFAAAFTLAAPFATDGPTDIFFARIGPGNDEDGADGN
jgi:hypothetical protein